MKGAKWAFLIKTYNFWIVNHETTKKPLDFSAAIIRPFATTSMAKSSNGNWWNV